MSAKNKVPSDQKALTNMLINVLELLEINSSNFNIKLSSDIFKNPDKELFRKIMCFLLKTIGGFEDWLALYAKPIIATKVEAQFKTSIKDIIQQLNQRWPTANLKTVNQSFLVAPQGTKVISFLLSLSKFTLIVVCERCGETYIPPNASEMERFLEENVDYGILQQKLERQIEQLLIERDKILLDESSSQAMLMTFIESNDCQNSGLKKLKNFDEITSTVNKWWESIVESINTQQEDLEKLELLSKQLFELKKKSDEIMDFHSIHFDGMEMMKELGLKSNAAVKMKGIELVEDGKLNFISLLKLFNVHLKEFNQNLDVTLLENRKLCVKKRLEKFVDSYENIYTKKEVCVKVLNTYEPLMKKFCESAEAEKAILSNDILKTIYECEKNKNYIINNELELMPLPKLTSPSAEKVSGWIRDTSENSSRCDSLGSERKIKSLRASPSLGRKSGRKLNLFMKKSENLNDRKIPHFGLAPLVGLCMENRRATLASPQMARRERFKVQHIDDRRKPLKPMKALFTASSPLSESTRSFHSEKMTSFGEQSKVEVAEECILELHSASSVVSYNSPKCTSLTAQPVICTPELLEWDRSSSDSDFSCSPTADVPPPCGACNDSQPNLNDSTQHVIDKFKTFKSELNLSQ